VTHTHTILIIHTIAAYLVHIYTYMIITLIKLLIYIINSTVACILHIIVTSIVYSL